MAHSTQVELAKLMYNARAPSYDDSFHPAFAKHMAHSLELKPGEKVLDLACGTGLVTLAAAQAVGPTGLVVGVDVSEGMLAELVEKINQEPDLYGQHVKIYRHDITKLDKLADVKQGEFDAISCASALVLLQEPGIALQQWAEYLRPGGRLVVDTTDANNIPWATAIKRVHVALGLEPPFHREWAKDRASLRRILQSAGYEVEKEWFKESEGSGTTYHAASDADELFDKQIQLPLCKALVDRGLVEEARLEFRKQWESVVGTNGKIEQIDGVHCAIARKPPSTDPMVQGSCACGEITWSAFAEHTSANNCYCSTCRKLSGSPYLMFLRFPLSKIRFTPPLGKPFLQTFKKSPYAERGFCGECGSPLTMWYKSHPDRLYMTTGSVDEGRSVPGAVTGSTKHIYTADVPSWYTIPEDGLPRHDTMPGLAEMLSN